MIAALASALHLLGVALVGAFSALRLAALRRRDVPAIRLADNGNGIGALCLFGAGLWRLFSGLEKPLGFYTANPVFWIKMTAIGLMVALEAYPQYVVFPWHIRHARGLPIEPQPGQLERMHTLCAAQLPLLVVAIVAAAAMARGVGLPTRPAPPPSDHPGAAIYQTYCRGCHQPDGRGLDGRAAGDFVGDPTILARPDAELLASIARGKTGRIGVMPPHGRILTAQQQRDVLAYIRQAFGARPPP